MSNSFIHGKSGKFLVGSTDFAVTEFGVTWTVDDDDITHTGASGAQVVLAGIERLEGTVTFVYDVLNKPTVAPQQLKPGTVATVHFKPDGVDDFSCSVLCNSFDFKSGPKAGTVMVNVKVKSTGAITSPSS